MNEPRVVLCPVDFSPLSSEVYRHAAALAAESRASLVLLHVVEPLLVQAAAMTYEPDYVQHEANAALEQLAAELDSGGLTAPPVLRVRVGLPHAEILEAVTAEGAQLIVTGTHGQTGAARLFFGSTVLRVLRHAPAPVLAIPAKGRSIARVEDGRPVLAVRRVIAAVDFSDSTAHTVNTAAALAARWRASLMLAHVVPPARGLERFGREMASHQEHRLGRAQEELTMLAQEVRAQVPDVHVHGAAGHPEEVLAGLADEQDGTLLVMGLRTAPHLFSPQPGSTAYHVLCVCRAPVLVVPTEQAGAHRT